MRILVLSDSHHLNITNNFNEYDHVIHCGDRGNTKLNDSIYYVKGNCDLSGNKEIIISIMNKNVFITHGDKYNVKYSYDKLYYRALELNVSAVVFGHTHIPCLFVENDILFMNPGAYKDGYYAVINDDRIDFYKDSNIYKTIEYKW